MLIYAAHTHMTIETETMTTTASGKASEDKTKSFPKTTIRTTEQIVCVCVCLRSIHIVDIDPHPKPSSPQTILNCFVAEKRIRNKRRQQKQLKRNDERTELNETSESNFIS